MKMKSIKSLLAASVCVIALTGCGVKLPENAVKTQPDTNTAEMSPIVEQSQSGEKSEPEDKAKDKVVEDVDASSTEAAKKEEVVAEALTIDKAFAEFLSGERICYSGDDFESALSYAFGTYDDETFEFSNMLSDTATMSYTEILDGLNENSEIIFLDMSKVTKSYTIGKTCDGGEIAVLKLQNLGIYDANDDSFALLFFALKDDKLMLTYAYDSWCRSYCPLMDGMILMGTGSGGAGDSYSWAEYIDKSGHKKALYSIETLYSEWIAMDAMFSYEMDTENWSADDAIISTVLLADKSYYYIDSEGTGDKDKLYEYIGHLKDAGYVQTTDLDGLISECYKEAGIKDAAPEEFNDWTEIK